MNILTELIPESMKKNPRNYKNVYFQAFSLFCELHKLKSSDCATLCPFQIASHA